MGRTSRECLLLNGCSHAAGSEIDPLSLEPRGWTPEKAFGAHLARRLGFAQHINLAMPGGSNERILRTTLEYLGTHGSEFSPGGLFVVVLWTGPARFEVYDETWRTWINLCPGVQDTRWFDDYPPPLQNYFKYHVLVRTSPVEVATRRWVEVLLLQAYLKNQGIPYLFCNAYHPLDTSDGYASFRAQLDASRYYRPFDEDATFWHTLRAAGFKVRSPGPKIPRGFQGHYGEDGHVFWAELLTELLVNGEFL